MSVNALGGTTLNAAQTEAKKTTFVNDEPVSIMEFDAGKANKTVDIDQVSTDGSDDGKLSAGEVAKLAVKGAGEDVKNALTSPLGIIGIIGVTALSICPVTAPFVAPLVVAGAAVGIGAGAVKTVSGIGKMISADSDAEAKGGAKEVGSGIYTTGVSAATLKAGLNQMAKVEGSHMEAAYREGTSKTKAYFQDVNDLTGNKFGTLAASVKNKFGGNKLTEAQQQQVGEIMNRPQSDIDALIEQTNAQLGDGGGDIPPQLGDGGSNLPGPHNPNGGNGGGGGSTGGSSGGNGSRVLSQSEIDTLIRQMNGGPTDVLQPDTILNADGSIAGIYDSATGLYYEPQALGNGYTTAAAQTVQSSFPKLSGNVVGDTLTLPPAGTNAALPSGNIPPSLSSGASISQESLTIDPRLFTILQAKAA